MSLFCLNVGLFTLFTNEDGMWALRAKMPPELRIPNDRWVCSMHTQHRHHSQNVLSERETEEGENNILFDEILRIDMRDFDAWMTLGDDWTRGGREDGSIMNIKWGQDGGREENQSVIGPSYLTLHKPWACIPMLWLGQNRWGSASTHSSQCQETSWNRTTASVLVLVLAAVDDPQL